MTLVHLMHVIWEAFSVAKCRSRVVFQLGFGAEALSSTTLSLLLCPSSVKLPRARA